MSASLLRKSLRLLEDNDQAKGGTKKAGRHSKRKKQLSVKKSQDNKDDTIKKNLAKLQLLSSEVPTEISKQVFHNTFKETESKQTEESTVFTKKDFEDFDKEYFVS